MGRHREAVRQGDGAMGEARDTAVGGSGAETPTQGQPAATGAGREDPTPPVEEARARPVEVDPDAVSFASSVERVYGPRSAPPRWMAVLGLAQRARALASGREAAERAIRSGEARLVVLATDAPQAVAEHLTEACRRRSVLCVRPGKKADLGSATGRTPRTVIAVTDANLAHALAVSLPPSAGGTGRDEGEGMRSAQRNGRQVRQDRWAVGRQGRGQQPRGGRPTGRRDEHGIGVAARTGAGRPWTATGPGRQPGAGRYEAGLGARRVHQSHQPEQSEPGLHGFGRGVHGQRRPAA